MSDRFEELAVRVIRDMEKIETATNCGPIGPRLLLAEALRIAYQEGAEAQALSPPFIVLDSPLPEGGVESGLIRYMPLPSKDAATLARVRRLSAESGRHFRGESLEIYLEDALDNDPSDKCPACSKVDCEVWGTV